MRVVDKNKLEVGMVVAKPIYNEEGKCLINTGFKLTEITIDRIKMLDYDRIFIKDAYDCVVLDLSDALKIKAVRTIKSIYTGFSSKKPVLDKKKLDLLECVVVDVVDEIIKNKQCCIQLSNMKNFNNGIYEHAIDVARISVLIGANITPEIVGDNKTLRKDRLVNLCLAAMLHDIGKTQVSSSLINTNTPFTDKQIAEMKSHTNLGCLMLKQTGRFGAEVYMPVLQHHERYDGNGYPEGREGTRINLFARIIKIADKYCNMRTGTLNEKSYIQSDVLEYLNADNSRQFDPEILKIFLSKVPVYEVGQQIKLSNGKWALVIQNNEMAIARPIVKLIKQDKTLGEEIDLFKNCNITIIS